ncbi:MAG: MFS transporter [Oscillospiraceae bacterium]|nr:MFS transporter [Oscillospiraceae bacterium]
MKADKDTGKKDSPLIFYIFYFVVFFGNAIQGSFLTLYLTNAGLPQSTVGLLNGITQCLSLIVLPVVGRLADKAPTKNRVLCIELLIAIVTLILFSRAKNIIAICIFRVAYSLFFMPIASVYQTITMEYANKNGWDYGPIRMTGTIGFSLMALAAGLGMNKNISMIFPFLIGSYVLTFILALMLPESRRVDRPLTEGAKEGSDASRIFSILKNRRVRNVMMMYFMYSFATSLNNMYFGLYTRQLGGTMTMVGLGSMILGFSELPFHLGPGKRWLERIGLEKSMLVVITAGIIRWAVCALTKNAWVMVFTMAFNGIMLVPVTIGLVKFLYDNAPEDLKVTAQTSLHSSVSVAAMLLADFGGSLVHTLLERARMDPIKNQYVLLVPLFIAVLLIGYTSMKRGEREDTQSASEQI